MDINRNQVFLVGMVALLMGLQFHLTDSFVLTPKASKILADQSKNPVATASNTVESLVGAQAAIPPQTIRPPEWIGWFLMSLGSVFILHSWTMAKPA
jgi:hypothetical protein